MKNIRLILIMAILAANPVPGFASQDISSSATDIPAENSVKGEMPPWSEAEVLARKILAALGGNQPADQNQSFTQFIPLFFPKDAFIRLKKIPDPGGYYGKLLEEFSHHVDRQRAFVKKSGPLTFVGFQKGSCKWKEAGSEYNSIPYWSCFKSRIKATDPKGAKVELTIRTIINWGKSWYITHLGL